MNEEEILIIGCKGILVGEYCANKTGILSRFLTNTFNTTDTNGASYFAITMNIEGNKFVEFELWDTEGVEKYRSFSKIFYKDAKACLLVYDITKRYSFQKIENYWLRDIRENAPKNISKKYIIIIIGSFSIGWK